MRWPHVRVRLLANVPGDVDRSLKKKARESGKSFNQVALEALAIGAGERSPKRDLREIAGSLSKSEAGKIDDAIRCQREIDPELWK